jgi:hypothetical protein
MRKKTTHAEMNPSLPLSLSLSLSLSRRQYLWLMEARRGPSSICAYRRARVYFSVSREEIIKPRR